MSLEERFYSINENAIDFEAFIEETNNLFNEEKEKGNIKEYKYLSDTDVFDSCGLDIYYVSVCWVDKYNKLNIVGASYWRT